MLSLAASGVGSKGREEGEICIHEHEREAGLASKP